MPDQSSFVIYTDFEASLQGLEEEIELYSEAPYTKRINYHVPSGFCTYSTFAYREVEDPLRLFRSIINQSINQSINQIFIDAT